MALLFEQLESVFCNEFAPVPRPEIPPHIAENLKHDLREYQTKALQNFIFLQNSKPKNHLLFHMATGSGKTMIIAATILELYARGYRNFLFFVNTQNIIIKTKDNLANRASAKYLFKDKITINGKDVDINVINGSFEESRAEDINILFTTMQGLHTSLTTLRENSVTPRDFTDKKLVLIADEAHHLDNESENEQTWFKTVQNLLATNKENMLLEFTATARLHNDFYNDKIIYDYPLKKFREDGYSKEVTLLSSNFTDFEGLDDKALRMLQAVMISEYRRMVAEENGISLKPVVMFKNKSTKQADENFAVFSKLIEKLESKHLAHIKEHSKDVTAIAWLQISDTLVSRLKIAFAPEKCVLIYGTSADKERTLKNLNEMEAPYNQIRAIFAVEILNEGWDVLNLFDIVKLDEAPTSANKTTTKEAQLIGRGARYFPFSLEADDRYKRKFDNDLTNSLRILEEMTFHSINENRYIKAIKSELTKSGIADFDETEETTVTMRLKEEFKTHPYYEKGGVWVNKRVAKNKDEIDGIKSYIPNFKSKNPTIMLTNSAVLTTGFDDAEPSSDTNLAPSTLKMSDISPLAVRSAINKIEFFYFANLKKQFPKLCSINEFITSKKYLGGVIWTVYSDNETPNINEYEKRKAVIALLEEIKKGILKNNNDYEGTKEFCPEPIKSKITDKTIKVKPKPSGEGMKRKKPPLLLDKLDWYVYDENYGTSEEMDFVAFFDTQYASLCQKYEDIKLIRNEKAYWIYSFEDNGQRFEPDFILLMREKKDKTLLQIFIEPKGDQLLDLDAWKERFLLSLDKATNCKAKVGLIVDDESLKIFGLPFYNKNRENIFATSFEREFI